MNDKQLVENLQDLLSDIGGDVYHIEQAHGFITAIIIGPKMIMPGEWLPFIFDSKGRSPEFKSDAEMSVFPMIMEFYNHIIATLDSGEFAPVIMGYRQRKKINIHPAPWCNAFIEGTGFCRDEWFGEDNEELMSLMTPILHFADQKEIHGIKEPVNGKNLPKADELLDAIPDSVLGIREYWRKKQFGSVGFAGGEMGGVKTGSGAMPDNLVPFEKRPPKVGRNEPCSCGSGKKYKKCCGAGQ